MSGRVGGGLRSARVDDRNGGLCALSTGGGERVVERWLEWMDGVGCPATHGGDRSGGRLGFRAVVD
jgi:hypothetical protein